MKFIGRGAGTLGISDEQFIVAVYDDTSALPHELAPNHLVQFQRLEMNTSVRPIELNSCMQRRRRFVRRCCVKELSVDRFGRSVQPTVPKRRARHR